MQNKPEIEKIITQIQDQFESESESKEEQQVSFLDSFNKLIGLIIGDKSVSIYTALDPESLKQWKQNRFKRNLKALLLNNIHNFFYITLLATITIFLVGEAVGFYADGGLITSKVYFKAILTEISFIFLSGYRSRNKIELGIASLLRVGVFSLMMFVISSETLLHGTKTVENSAAIQEQVVFLEQQIKEKEETIKFYKDKGWGTSTNRHVKEKDELVAKLIALKEKQADGANHEVSKLVNYKSYGNAFFRLILLFISLLISRRIFVF